MLEVEVAANTVYAWAAEEMLARRLAEERPTDPAGYTAAVRREAQALRYRAHDRLLRAFLDEEVYDAACGSSPSAGGAPLRGRCSTTEGLSLDAAATVARNGVPGEGRRPGVPGTHAWERGTPPHLIHHHEQLELALASATLVG
jgi:hypothetical protein